MLPIQDRSNPRNWSTAKRWYIAIVIGNLIAPIDMSSTLYAGAQTQIREQFKVSQFVATLGVGFVNLGIAIGPLIGAPLSEMYGRQPLYIASVLSFTLFSLGSALSQNITSLLLTRFLGSLLSSAVFSNFGGSLSDMFTPDERGPLIAMFSFVLQGCPTIGPLPGNIMGEYLNWRWVLGFSSIWGAVVTIPVLFLPETEHSKIERVLARETEANKSWKSMGATNKNEPTKGLWGEALLTPLALLIYEPIVLATSIYHAFVYSLLFILLEVYPHVYQTTYGFNQGQIGLVFISPWIGNALGVLLYFGYFKPAYSRKQLAFRSSHESDTSSTFSASLELKPEERLPGVILSAILVPVGLFWFALTCTTTRISWIVPVLSGIPTGAGMTLLQLSLTNYYIDLYPTVSASALAANLFLRLIIASWFPTFAVPMYERLGMQNAGLLLAGISLAGIPGGWVLWSFGGRLRQMS